MAEVLMGMDPNGVLREILVDTSGQIVTTTMTDEELDAYPRFQTEEE